MNLKERGITVGDLLIILIIIITSTILIKSFSKDKKSTQVYLSKTAISDLDYKHKEWSKSIDSKF